jgi:hypothetical protein
MEIEVEAKGDTDRRPVRHPSCREAAVRITGTTAAANKP